jgi:nucleoside-diphosphate-sugar epimerase
MKEETMVKPAEEGMKTILRACIQNKVKRLIVTSSVSSIIGDNWKRGSGTGKSHYDHNDFGPVEETKDLYAKSKMI